MLRCRHWGWDEIANSFSISRREFDEIPLGKSVTHRLRCTIAVSTVQDFTLIEHDECEQPMPPESIDKSIELIALDGEEVICQPVEFEVRRCR